MTDTTERAELASQDQKSPPAAGWNEAQVNADADYLDALESELIAKDFDMRLERRELSPSIVADHLREAISHQPAAAETNASAEARLREALEVSGDAIGEYYRYWTGGESRGSYDGRPERANLWKAMYAVRAALKALSAHTHTSDCDKQECMGDMAPGDPKDLAELLAKPSVLEPSDRTASDCGKQDIGPVQHWAVKVHVNGVQVLNIETEYLSGIPNIDDYAETVRNCANHLLSFIGEETTKSDPVQDAESASGAHVADRTGGAHPPTGASPSDRTADVTVELKPFEWSKINAYEACNGTLWRTAEEATVESRSARDAFTVGRR